MIKDCLPYRSSGISRRAGGFAGGGAHGASATGMGLPGESCSGGGGGAGGGGCMGNGGGAGSTCQSANPRTMLPEPPNATTPQQATTPPVCIAPTFPPH